MILLSKRIGIFTLTLILLVLFLAPAETALASSNFSFEYLHDGTVRITRYIGSQSTVHIPERLNEQPVSTIGIAAFADNPHIRTVTFPKTLRHIELCAFAQCTALSSVSFAEGVETIADYAFGGCKALYTVTLPKSVRDVSTYAFHGTGLADSAFSEAKHPASLPSSLEKRIWAEFSTAADDLRDSRNSISVPIVLTGENNAFISAEVTFNPDASADGLLANCICTSPKGASAVLDGDALSRHALATITALADISSYPTDELGNPPVSFGGRGAAQDFSPLLRHHSLCSAYF